MKVISFVILQLILEKQGLLYSSTNCSLNQYLPTLCVNSAVYKTVKSLNCLKIDAAHPFKRSI